MTALKVKNKQSERENFFEIHSKLSNIYKVYVRICDIDFNSCFIFLLY